MFTNDQEGFGILVVPRANKGLQPIVLDLKEVNLAESRIEEIGRANPLTLPDLISTFNLAMVRLTKMISGVELELRNVKREKEEFEAIARLDKVEEFLEKKKVKSTTDTRDAAVILDPEVRELRAKYDTLVVISEFLGAKLKNLEYAYHGAKKVCDVNGTIGDKKNYGGNF